MTEVEKKKIMIVDDDQRNIFALSATLRHKGYDVISTQSAQEAIRILEERSDIRTVLMDMMMPEMDGYEAVNALRSNAGTRSLFIVAVTARAMPGDREKCLAAGANEYVSKPIDVDALLMILNRINNESSALNTN